RRDGDVEGLGHVRDLEPRRDAADAAGIDLDDRTGVTLEILAEMQVRIKALADGDGDRGVLAEAAVALDVVGAERLLEPADVEPLIGPRPADGLVDAEGLVGVGEDLEAGPDGLAHRADAGDVL